MTKPKKITPQNALERLMDLCSRSEKSPYEIASKLKQWGLAEQSGSIIEQLKKENFLSEERFAKAFARDKAQFNKWGKIKIRYYLRGHQIKDSIIESALDEIQADDYEKMLSNELLKKWKSLKKGTEFEKKGKLYAFGNQRGYEPEFINRFLDTVSS